MSWAELFSTDATESLTWFDPVNQQSQARSYLDWYKGTIPSKWTVPDHIKVIAEHLDGVDSGQIKRLAIHMPPRHAKSETVTVRYPLKFLEENPAENVLVTGYNERFARKFGRKTRNLAVDRGIVAEDKSAADEWATSGGGLYMSRGVGSPPTGTGFARIIIDDPIRRREDAESETYRDKAWDWYSEDLYSRLEPNGAIVLVCTLWHEDDVAARAVASEPGEWTVLKLPAIDEGGHALWPQRYPVEALEKIRGVMGAYGFNAIYQQDPTPREGTFFQVSKLRIAENVVPPSGAVVVDAWDLAASEADGDWTARARMWRDEERFYIEPLRFRHEPAERNRRIRLDAETGRPRIVRIPQDPGAAGKESAQSLTRLLAGFYAKALPVSGDKFVRAEPFAAQVNAGNVVVVRPACDRYFDGGRERSLVTDYIEELRTAPSGKHDDWIDASADAFNEITSGQGRGEVFVF